MRTFFPIIATAAALMLAATSCTLSFEDDYNFGYEIAFELQTEEQVEAVKAYFEDFFKTHGNYTFHGEYSAAVEKSLEYFLKDSQDLDQTYIQQLLVSDEDLVRLMLVISSSQVKTITAYQTWQGKPINDD